MTKNSGNTDIILSRTMRVTCTDQDSNVLLVGESGPGISSYIASNMLQAREVYVAADLGGSLYRQYGGFLKDMGYRVKCLDLIDFAGNRYNPFKYIRNDEDIRKITETMYSRASSSFYEAAEKVLIEALVAYVRYHMPEDERNFSSVLELMKKAETESGLDKIFEDTFETSPTSYALERYADYKRIAGNAQRAIFVSCAVRLQLFGLSETEHMMNADDIGLDSLWDEKTALFIVTPTDDSIFNVIATMLYSQLFDMIDHCCSRYPLPIYTKIFLDGRAGLPCLDGVLFKGGKRRLSVSVAVRDAEQLKEACGGIWEEISKVFDAMIFLSGGQTIKRSFITLAFDDRRIPSRSNGASDSEDDRSHWVDEMFCGLAEDECLVAVFTRGVGTARKDRRYVVSEHPNWSIAEQSMQENS